MNALIKEKSLNDALLLSLVIMSKERETLKEAVKGGFAADDLKPYLAMVESGIDTLATFVTDNKLDTHPIQ